MSVPTAAVVLVGGQGSIVGAGARIGGSARLLGHSLVASCGTVPDGADLEGARIAA